MVVEVVVEVVVRLWQEVVVGVVVVGEGGGEKSECPVPVPGLGVSTGGRGVGNGSGSERAVCIVTRGASAWCNLWPLGQALMGEE